MERGDASVMFYGTHEHDHDHPESPVMTGSICLYPDDVDALWEELKEKVEIAWP